MGLKMKREENKVVRISRGRTGDLRLIDEVALAKLLNACLGNLKSSLKRKEPACE
jgi:hypothetical protein